jgi:hypothetical protein
VGEYIEIEIATGKTTRDLFGYDFTPSPDGKAIAHVGGVPHFGPAQAHSNYLQLDDVTIYPLPNGMGPVKQDWPSGGPPYNPPLQGATYVGIHEFMHGLYWSPDSRRIAFIDCIYDWTPNHPATLSAGDGVESNRQCSIAVVVVNTGKFALQRLPTLSKAELNYSQLAWDGPRTLIWEIKEPAKTFTFPD